MRAETATVLRKRQHGDPGPPGLENAGPCVRRRPPCRERGNAGTLDHRGSRTWAHVCGDGYRAETEADQGPWTTMARERRPMRAETLFWKYPRYKRQPKRRGDDPAENKRPPETRSTLLSIPSSVEMGQVFVKLYITDPMASTPRLEALGGRQPGIHTRKHEPKQS